MAGAFQRLVVFKVGSPDWEVPSTKILHFSSFHENTKSKLIDIFTLILPPKHEKLHLLTNKSNSKCMTWELYDLD